MSHCVGSNGEPLSCLSAEVAGSNSLLPHLKCPFSSL